MPDSVDGIGRNNVVEKLHELVEETDSNFARGATFIAAKITSIPKAVVSVEAVNPTVAEYNVLVGKVNKLIDAGILAGFITL